MVTMPTTISDDLKTIVRSKLAPYSDRLPGPEMDRLAEEIALAIDERNRKIALAMTDTLKSVIQGAVDPEQKAKDEAGGVG
jgi:hypothetical protein